MDKGKLTFHSNAVNLARRLTELNENDLMMENLYEQDGFLQPKKTYTKTECEALSSHLIHLKSLPQQCMQYTDIATELRRRDSDTTHPTQILS